MIGISAQHAIAIADLFDAILEQLPTKKTYIEAEEPRCRVVILGKPNVGKSSLLNLLLKKERAIVDDMPGTTREPIKERLSFLKESIELIDTPGIRRKRGVTEPLEKLMVKSALRALDDADVVVLVIDASEGRMVDQELKLAFYVFEECYKGLIIMYNKDDLVDEEKREELKHHLVPYRYFLDKVEEVRTSVISKKNVGKLLKKIDQVCKRYMLRFSDDELTALIKEALTKKPLYRARQRLIVHRVKQLRTGPITLQLIVSEPRWFGPSQLGFFDNILRKHIDLKGVPIKFLARKKGTQ